MQENKGFDRLHGSLVGVIQEAQTKIGYDRHAITFYYPASSVAHMLGTKEDADAVERALRGFAAHEAPTLGAVEVVRDGERSASMSRRRARSLSMRRCPTAAFSGRFSRS